MTITIKLQHTNHHVQKREKRMANEEKQESLLEKYGENVHRHVMENVKG